MELVASFWGLLGGGFGGALASYALERRAAIASQVRAQKRDLYASLAHSLGVFQGDRAAGEKEREAFLRDYSQVWLWASDEVIAALNRFIDHNQRLAAGEPKVQEKLDQSFHDLMLAMRKDLRSTSLTSSAYRSISFG